MNESAICLTFNDVSELSQTDWCWELLWEHYVIGLGSLSQPYLVLLDDKWVNDAINIDVATKIDYLRSVFCHWGL